MSFTIPNSADVTQVAAYGNGAMARFMSSDVAIIEAAQEGYAVYSGCQLIPGATAGTVKVNSGTGIWNGVQADVSAQDNIACVASADATNPKWILYELDSSGTIQRNIGTAAANPVTPTPTASRIVIGAVLVPANATTVDAAYGTGSPTTVAKIIDKRMMRTGIDIRTYIPVAGSMSADGVTNTTATTWNSGTTALSSLVGSQTVTLTSTAGLAATNGVLVVTHSAVDYVITYTAVSGSTITNCTWVQTGGNPSVSVANADVVTRAKVVTSATAAFSSSHVSSYLAGSAANLPQGVTITGTGSVPGGGTWAQLSAAATGSATGLTFTFSAVTYTWTKPAGARFVRVWQVAGGGGGGSGSRVANITTAAHGGGGGACGAVSEFTFPASGLASSYTLVAPMGGPGGYAVSTNANGTTGTSGQSANFDVLYAIGGNGGAAGATGGGAGGTLGSANAGGNVVGKQTPYNDGSWHLGPPQGGKGADGTAPAVAVIGSITGIGPGSGGGGGGNSAASALQAAAGGGKGSDVGLSFVQPTAAGAVANATAGTAGGSASAVGVAGGYTELLNALGLCAGGGAGGNGHNVANGTGGAGGNGGRPGGGGGGGGNGISTGTSGAGGTGGDGIYIVVTY